MAYLAMPHLVKFVFLLAIAVLATLSAAGGSITDITDPKYIEAAINELELDSNHSYNRGFVYIDNLFRPSPAFNPEPLSSTLKRVVSKYTEIILACFPMLRKFPPGPAEDNMCFSIPEIAARVNRYQRAGSQEPIRVWLHPYLHVPYVDSSEFDDFRELLDFRPVQPEDMAFYLQSQANHIFGDTVVGFVSLASSLVMESYRNWLRTLKYRLTKRYLELGLVIDTISFCEQFPGTKDDFKDLLPIFDAFFLHFPRMLADDLKSGKELEDAIMERKMMQVVFVKCKELLGPLLPVGASITPVRGYLEPKYNGLEDNGFNFRFDVVRF